MISQKNTNVEEQDIKLGGFPPILFVGLKNKKIKEFAKLNDKDDNTKNISKLNILDIKNILGVI